MIVPELDLLVRKLMLKNALQLHLCESIHSNLDISYPAKNS